MADSTFKTISPLLKAVDMGDGTFAVAVTPMRSGRTATVVIAAKDALVKSKAQADITCDGIDDQDKFDLATATLPA